MKNIRNYLFFSLLAIGLLNQLSELRAAELNLANEKTFIDLAKESIGSIDYAEISALLGVVGLCYGYNFLSDYIPEELMNGAIAMGSIYGLSKLLIPAIEHFSRRMGDCIMDNYRDRIKLAACMVAKGFFDGLRERDDNFAEGAEQGFNPVNVDIENNNGLAEGAQ